MKYLLLIYIAFQSLLCVAQRQNVYFLKNDGRRVELKDSADFVRVVREPDSGSVFYNILEYYPKGQAKRFTKSSKIDPVLSLEGACLDYFENGKPKAMVYYKSNTPFGEAYRYYPNGKLYLVEDYGIPDTTHKYQVQPPDDPLIKTCNDSTGKVLVADGNGYYPIYSTNFKQVNEEGAVKNGRKTGEWKGLEENQKLKFTEFYEAGTLLNGSATDSAGTYTYKIRSINPRYKTGIDGFYRYLGTQIIYPDVDRKNNGQGVVFLSFEITKTGVVKNIKVIRSVTPTIDAEAVRVLNKSKDWLPGVYFGRLVNSKFTIPIKFALDP